MGLDFSGLQISSIGTNEGKEQISEVIAPERVVVPSSDHQNKLKVIEKILLDQMVSHFKKF